MDVAELEKRLAEEETAAEEGAAEDAKLKAEADNPEDYWSPVRDPLPPGEPVDVYGPISPVPEHDGTECLKWDSSLWSHGDHFKVS